MQPTTIAELKVLIHLRKKINLRNRMQNKLTIYVQAFEKLDEIPVYFDMD